MMAAVDDRTAPPPPGTGLEGRVPRRDWAVPGSAEQQPTPDPSAPVDTRSTPLGPGAAPAGDPGSSPVDAGSRPGSVPRVALRPMTAADILDGGFAVVKARPLRILAITAGFVVPTHLLAAFLQRNASGGLGIADLLSEDPTVLNEQANGDPTAELLAGLLLTVIPAIALVCVAAAVAHLVSQWTMGRDAPAGEMLGVVGRRWWPLLGSFVIVKLAEGAGVLGCYVGIAFVMALFVPVAPIVGVEGGGPIEVVRRSVRLTRGRYFPTLGIALLMGLVSWLLGNALSALPQALAAWIGFDDGWPLLALGSIASQIVVLPFVASATVLLYLDLRVRTEGLDLEMSAIDVFDRAG
jgi:hypothetical protein